MEAETTINFRHHETADEVRRRHRADQITVGYLEDDQAQQVLISKALGQHHFHCRLYTTVSEMQQAFRENDSCDIALLDWDLGPGESGLDMVHFLRATQPHDLPIIMLSARQSHNDVTTLIHAGADDYLTKPVQAAELIRLMTRYLTDIEPVTAIRVYGSYADDTVNQRFFYQGKHLSLSSVEYAIAQLFFRSAGRLVTHSMILNAASNAGLDGVSRVESLIHRFKKKMRLHQSTDFRLEVFHHCGYRLTKMSDATDYGAPGIVQHCL